jgi:hypothetical protein
MKNFLRATAAAAAVLSLISCGGGTTVPQMVGEIPIPNNPAALVFDISWVDSAGHYYIADRTNKAVDMFDTSSLANLAVITGGFAGAVLKPCSPAPCTGAADNAHSGPDGVVGTGGNIFYIGDVGSVKVLDSSLKQVTLPIQVNVPGTSTKGTTRVDEGCYDPDDKLLMYATPEEGSGPFITWIDTTTNTVKTQYQYTDPSELGLEQCAYDSATKSFYINNDGVGVNPGGQVDVFTAASVVAATMAAPPAPLPNPYPLGGCNPTGMALGPGTDVLISCTPDAGKPLTSLIINRKTGATVATLKLGGADQVAYDSVTNRYFMPMRYWVDGGVSIGSSAAAGLYNANFAVVDASSFATIVRIPCGRNTHSIAIDGPNHKAFLPHTAGNAVAPNPGISVYSTQ